MRRIIAAALAGALVFSFPTMSVAGSTPPPPSSLVSSGHSKPWAVWLIFGCVAGTVFTAVVANAHNNRELTQHEAVSCGLLYWLNGRRR